MPADILICDDHRLFTDSLAVALQMRGFDVVAVTYDARECVALVGDHRPAVCLLDHHFVGVDSLAVLADIAFASPETRVVILTGSAELGLDRRVVAAGAAGFTRKDMGLDHIVAVIEGCLDGELVTSTHGGRPLSQPEGPTNSPRAFLTERELEVLERLVDGQDTARIAAELGIAYTTARTHIQHMLVKLGAHSKLEAVAFALSQGLVRAPSVG